MLLFGGFVEAEDVHADAGVMESRALLRPDVLGVAQEDGAVTRSHLQFRHRWRR